MNYHSAMRNVLVAVILLAAVPAVLAQVRGVPPSVTSSGWVGGQLSIPPSVTSLGPCGWNACNSFGGFGSFTFGHSNLRVGIGNFEHRRHHHFATGYVPYYIPYYVDSSAYYAQPQPDAAAEPDPPAPTVFEHRPTSAYGPADRYGEHYLDSREQRPRDRQPAPDDNAASAQPAAPSPEDPTVLVFRDGHRAEVTNYAIVGDTLYNLSGSPHVPRKVQIADLDLEATIRANDERGMDFAIPQKPASDSTRHLAP